MTELQCSRTWAHPRHDTDTGPCVGRPRAAVDEATVAARVEAARMALHAGGTR